MPWLVVALHLLPLLRSHLLDHGLCFLRRPATVCSHMHPSELAPSRRADRAAGDFAHMFFILSTRAGSMVTVCCRKDEPKHEDASADSPRCDEVD